MKKSTAEQWLYEIKPKGRFIDLNLREIWRYKDLLLLFVKRDISTVYKQTVLGPLWFFIQPLFTSVIFTLIFNKIGGVKTDGIDPFLFNLAGITLWNYFRECLNSTSNTFKANSSLFGKVYFPRVIVPASKCVSELMKYGIQLLIFVLFFVVYRYRGDDIAPSSYVALFPIYVFMIMLIAMGVGMILSALTTKYRDLSILISFGLSLLMYVSAVMYPLSEVEAKIPKYSWIVEYNPLSLIIDGYRNLLLGIGEGIEVKVIFTQFALGIIVFLIGLVIFNRTEKSFIDTV